VEWVETTGRSIEEAKDAALDQLGVDESDAEFVIVSEPRAGLFGRLRGEARVRARVRPTSPRPKRTRGRRDRERRSTAGAEGSRQGGRSAGHAGGVALAEEPEGTRDNATADGASSTPRSRNRRSRSRGGSQSRSQGGATLGGGDDAGAVGSQAGPRGDSRRNQGNRSPGPSKEESVGETLSLEEQGESARVFVSGLLQELGLSAQVSARLVDEDTAEVSVDGDSLGVLIGPGGATLGALQELARTFVQKQTGGHSGRIVIDVAGYRAKRVAALQRFTRQVGEEIKGSGKERALEPMSAADRKVVHDTVNDLGGLATRSEGEEPRRYIVISVQEPEAAEPDA